MSKKGLGRGLSALIPEIDVGDKDNIVELEMRLVHGNPRQPRKVFEQSKLEELARSVKEHGLIQPIIVRPTEGGYEIVAGERRWRAAQIIGLPAIPALVRSFSESETMEIALIENLQREDLNPLEEAEAYHILLEEFKQTQDELARRLGKSRPQITNTLRLLQLGEVAQEAVKFGKLSTGHAKVLLGITNASVQSTLCERVIDEDLTVRQLEAIVKKLHIEMQDRKKKEQGNEIELKEVEGRLREWFGTPVKLSSGGTKGKIEITFFGEEGLNRILEVIGLADKQSTKEMLEAPKGKFHV